MTKISKNKANKKQYIYIIVLILVNIFIVNISFIFGNSMKDTLHNGDIVLVYKPFITLRYNDIIITNRNNPYKVNLVKRVIATEGEHIVIKNNEVFINQLKLKEPYVKDIARYSGDIDLIIPKEKIFVMGDNRNFSKDSRDIGCVEMKNIKGKVIFRIFPFNKWERFINIK